MGKWVHGNLFIDDLGVVYDGDSKIIRSQENIGNIFNVFDWKTPLLEDGAISFVKSLQTFFESRGFLSDKQFKWLCKYYNMSTNYNAGLGDSEYYEKGNGYNNSSVIGFIDSAFSTHDIFDPADSFALSGEFEELYRS